MSITHLIEKLQLINEMEEYFHAEIEKQPEKVGDYMKALKELRQRNLEIVEEIEYLSMKPDAEERDQAIKELGFTDFQEFLRRVSPPLDFRYNTDHTTIYFPRLSPLIELFDMTPITLKSCDDGGLLCADGFVFKGLLQFSEPDLEMLKKYKATVFHTQLVREGSDDYVETKIVKTYILGEEL